MSALLKTNVSPRAALVLIALALAVSVVLGRDARPGASPPAAPPAAAPAAPPEPGLALEKLERPGLGGPLANLFTTPAPTSVAAPRAARAARAAAATPPSVPGAPPLPFRYLGTYTEDGRNAVYVARGDEPLLAAPGAPLGADYRVEEISGDAILLTYLPLGTRQRLPIPPQP